MSIQTTHAYIGKDLYKQPVWFCLVEEQDGTKRIAFGLSSTWEPVPRHLTQERRAEIHAAAVAAFGPPPESPSKPLGLAARASAMMVLEQKVEAFCAG